MYPDQTPKNNLMKILIVDTYYPEFLLKIYQDHPEYRHKSYKEQKIWLENFLFGTANFYSKNLRPQGIEAQEIIADNSYLQKQWAKEHHSNTLSLPKIPLLSQIINKYELFRILKKQIQEEKPDVLYFQNLAFCDPLTLHQLKKQVKLLVGQIACPLPPAPFVKAFDLILTSFPHFVEKIQKLGPKSEYFKIGFEASVIDEVSHITTKEYDVVFIGGFAGVHTFGTKTIEKLAQHTPIDIWGYGIESLASDSPIRKKYHGQAWGRQMYEIIKKAKICVNRHSTASEGYANNMRLYETTGLGTLLLTDQKKNISELFVPDQEIAVYANAEELVEKTKYFLEHADERERLAKAGQVKTLRDHTYAKRMEELKKILAKYI